MTEIRYMTHTGQGLFSATDLVALVHQETVPVIGDHVRVIKGKFPGTYVVIGRTWLPLVKVPEMDTMDVDAVVEVWLKAG